MESIKILCLMNIRNRLLYINSFIKYKTLAEIYMDKLEKYCKNMIVNV